MVNDAGFVGSALGFTLSASAPRRKHLVKWFTIEP
jgi:hypothetical protein